MDNITHSLFGLTLARTRLGRNGRGTTTALLLASSAPDIDFVSAARGSANYLSWHRGPTHGPLGVIGLGLVVAALVHFGGRFDRSHDGQPRASFSALALVSMLGVLLHVLMDLPTSYGTRLLSPFSWRWFGADWEPIVDIYLLVFLAAGLILGSLMPVRRQRNAALALALMTVNYGVRGVSHREALLRAPALFGPTLPAPCSPVPPTRGPIDSWARTDTRSNASGSSAQCLVEMAAMPSFVSPFRWRVIARLADAYELAELDLLDRQFWGTPIEPEQVARTTLRYPNHGSAAVSTAANTPLGQTFLSFSRFPAARTFVDASGATTVRWTDVRFAGGLLTLDSGQRPFPFTAVIRIAPDGRLLQEQMGGQ